MPTNLTCFRIFIASPGGLTDERHAFRDEIQDYNDSEAIHRGVLFQPFGWEDTLGGVGRPQSIINEDIRRADFFLLVLWNRWGSAPDIKSSRFSSGTEEEYHVALECYEASDQPMRQLVLLFKAVDAPQLSDPGPQLQSVLKFKKAMEEAKTHLFHTFDSDTRFRQLLRAHLGAWLRGWEKDSEDDGKQPPEPQIVSDRVSTRDSDMGERPEVSEPVDSSLTAKAWALADEGRLTEAEVEFARSIVGHQQPDALISYGRYLCRVGRMDQARALFERAIEIAERSEQQAALASAYASLGLVLKFGGDVEGAEQMYRKSLEINQKLGHLEGMASSYLGLGNTLDTRGDLSGAEEMYRKSLEINEKLGRSEGVARAYRGIGEVLTVRGDSHGAEQVLRKALEIDQKLLRLEGMAEEYLCLGTVLSIRGDLDGAEGMYRKSLEIDQKLGRLEGMASSYLGLGNVLSGRADFDGAEPMYRKALEIDERLGRSEGLAAAYGNLGIVLRARGDLEGAEQMYRKSLEIDEKLGRLEGMGTAYLNLGIVRSDRGDLEGAEQMYRKVLATSEGWGSSPILTKAKSLLQSLQDAASANDAKNKAAN